MEEQEEKEMKKEWKKVQGKTIYKVWCRQVESKEESIKAIMYNQHLCGFKSRDAEA